LLQSIRHEQATNSSENSSSDRAREECILPDRSEIEANIEDDEAQRDHQKPLDVAALTPTEAEYRIACDSGESTEIDCQATGAHRQRGSGQNKRPGWVLVAELRKEQYDSSAQDRQVQHEPGKCQQQCGTSAREQQQSEVSVPAHVE
jgi:hypothetical protein